MKEYKDYKYLTKAIALPNGKRKYIRAKTKRELDRKVLEFQIALSRENTVVSSDMTVEQLAQMWMEKVKKPSVKPQTYCVYENRVQRHLIPAIGNMQVQDVRYVNILDAVNNYGYSSKEAQKNYISAIRSIFRFAIDNELITKSPVPDRMAISGKATREDRPLTTSQAKALLDYCKQNKDPSIYLFTLIALVTGMRRGEIAALRWDCVDLQSGFIHVRRTMVGADGDISDTLKTESSKRDIPIPLEVVTVLRKYHAESPSTYVVSGSHNGHIHPFDMERYTRAWNNSGVSESHIHSHLFRKTFATRLIESGTDPKRVQYLLGHTKLDMTLGVYAKYDAESQAEKTREKIQTVFDSILKLG